MSTTLSGSITLINVDDGAKGDKGDTGDTGATGVSITNVINHYLATSASSGVTPSTSGWTTTIQTMTSTKQYLWNYEEVIGSNGNTISTTTPCIIGRYGQNGTNGTNGTNGEDGVGITSIVEWYQVSASNTTPPATPTQAGTGYSSSPVATTVNTPYLWNYEVISYTSGNPTITDARVIGTHGATGAAGSNGQMLYATSASAATTVAKTATLASGTLTLTAGATVAVTFTHPNTATNPTLNIAGTGAKPIYASGSPISGVYNWSAGDTCVFAYDGTHWLLTDQGNTAEYITKIASSGVFVHVDGMADDTDITASDAYGIHIDNSVEVVRGGTVMAEFGGGTNGDEIVLGDITGNNFFADANGITLRDATTELASFTASGTQIGKSTESHVVQNSTSWRMVDADKGDYAIIENIKSGTVTTVSEHFISESDLSGTYTLTFETPTIIAITVDGIETDTYTLSGQNVTVESDYLFGGADVIIIYTTTSDSIKAYMFGYRDKTPGVMSFGEGISNPTGMFSHSEGFDTESSGRYSHSEGKDTLASGDFSHAQNLGTVAIGTGQTAIGTFNIIDNDGEYLFIIGRGWTDGARDNALTVDSNGTICFRVFTVSDDLRDAIVSAGWESEVIE